MPFMGFFLVIGLIIAGIWFGIVSDHEFSAHCAKLGGHVEEFDSTGIGTDSNGKSVTTYSSTNVCLSKDGRILDHG